MSGFPDVLGLTLAEAEAILLDQGASYQVVETISRKKNPVAGELRVIRQTENSSRLFLVVCRVPDLSGRGAEDDDQ